MLCFSSKESQIYSQGIQTPLGVNDPDSLGGNGFKRWKWKWQQRLFPHGDFDTAAIAMDRYLGLQGGGTGGGGSRTTGTSVCTERGKWQFLGPNDIAVGNFQKGIGRIDVLYLHPQYDGVNNRTLFAGGFHSGLFKSTDDGNNWSNLNTDKLAMVGISDLAISPSNPEIMYLASCGYAQSDIVFHAGYSMGIWKTINGGQEYELLTLPQDPAPQHPFVITRVLVDPVNSNIILVGTHDAGYYADRNKGKIYRSDNGGVNFTAVANEYITDMEFHPTNSSIVYASGHKFMKSVNGGVTWNVIPNGFPSPPTPDVIVNKVPWVSYWRIAVSKAAEDKVYIQRITPNDYRQDPLDNKWKLYDFQRHIFVSDDKGENFIQNPAYATGAAVNRLLFGASNHLNTSTGKPDLYMDLGNDVSKSINEGANFIGLNGDYHVDQQSIAFTTYPTGANVIFIGNDGGVYKTDDKGVNWTPRCKGLAVTELYRLGVSQQDNKLMVGAQDGNVDYYDGTTWRRETYGDGMESIIDYDNPEIMYHLAQEGGFYRTFNGWTNQNNPNDIESGHWVTPFIMHPTIPTTLFTARKNVFKSTNSGSSWTNLTPTRLSGDNTAIALAIAQNNPQVLYVGFSPLINCEGQQLLFKTTDGGSIWDNVTPNIIPCWAFMTSIFIHPTEPNKVWVTFSQYSDVKKVLYTDDGGDNWIDFSDGLPEMPANTIVMDKESVRKTLYIGTDVGVYYRDTEPLMPEWKCFKTDLPNIGVQELEIDYDSEYLVAATGGRGVWQTPLDRCYTPPNEVPETLTANTNWSGGTRIRTRGIIIPSGITLTIRNNTTVKMPAGTSIIVEKGGKLIVNNSTITSTCNSVMWDGIQAYGDKTTTVNVPSAHGQVIIKDKSIIENAVEAIRNFRYTVIDGNDYGSTSGMISVTNSTMRNNKRSIELLSYAGGNSAIVIDNNKFEATKLLNDQGTFPGSSVQTHISMWDVNNVVVKNNTFKNTIFPTEISNPKAGIGVQFDDAPILLTNNKYVNLNIGVDAGIRGESGSIVTNEFTNTYMPITIRNGTDGSYMLVDKCKFKDNFEYGIDIRNNTKTIVQIADNKTFKNGNFGVVAADNEGTSLEFMGNEFESISNTAVQLTNSRPADPVSIYFENNKVRNSNTGFDINGLHLGVIINNEIRNIQTNSTLENGYGIKVINSNVVDFGDFEINGNDIRNDNLQTGTQSTNGIYVESSPNLLVNCNEIVSVSNAIKCEGLSLFTQLRSNEMSRCGNGVAFENNGIIGGQYTIYNNNFTTNDNLWKNNTNDTYIWKTEGSQNPFIVRDETQNGFHSNPVNNFPVVSTREHKCYCLGKTSPDFEPCLLGESCPLPITINQLPNINSCNSGGSGTGDGNNGGLATHGGGLIDGIATGEINFSIFNAETQYISQWGLMSQLVQRPNLIGVSPSISNFYTTHINSNIHKFAMIDTLIRANEMSAAVSLNNAIQPVNTIETNLKTVNTLFLNEVAVGTDSISKGMCTSLVCDAGKATLLPIANQCPLEGGPGVYRARNMIWLTTPSMRFVDNCPVSPVVMQPKIESNATHTDFSIYPNPASNAFTFIYTEGTQGSLEVYSTKGDKVGNYKLSPNSTKIDINTQNWVDGIYLCRLVAPTGTVKYVTKIIISQ